MPRLLFEFGCENQHITDHFVDTSITAVKCPECELEAKRLVSKPHFPLSQGVSGDMPSALYRWEKMQRSKNSGKMKDHNNDRYGGPRPQDL